MKKAVLCVLLCFCVLFAGCDGFNTERTPEEGKKEEPQGEVLTAEERWLASEKAWDYDGDGKTDGADYSVFLAYTAWYESLAATDYTGDRKIDYADYVYASAYTAWLGTEDASDYTSDGLTDGRDYDVWVDFCAWRKDGSDYNEDGKTDFSDYRTDMLFTAWREKSGEDHDDDGTVTYTDYLLADAVTAWKNSAFALDYNGDRAINYADYLLYTDENIWLASVLACDYTADEKRDGDDYAVWKEYLTWSVSAEAVDYSGDTVITTEDYFLADVFDRWFRENPIDVNGDLKTDAADFILYNKNKEFQGTFILEDFKATGVPARLKDSKFSLRYLEKNHSDFLFSVDIYGKMTCTYSEGVEKALGTDKERVDNAVAGAKLERKSEWVVTLTTTLVIEDIPTELTFYLTKTEKGYETTMSIVLQEQTVGVAFTIVYVKNA